MKALIGTKLGMTSIIDESGRSIPVTLVMAGPCTVTQVKTAEKEGYSAIQLGYGESKKLAKPQVGHLKQSGTNAKYLKEFRSEATTLNVGDKIDVEAFELGDKVKVTATSKGKGFAGTIKRHGFHRGPESHGGMNVRKPGSIGSQYPQKIFKGKRMAGRMGHETVSTRQLTVAYINKEQNVIGIKGAIPGPNRSVCYIVSEAKAGVRK